MQDISRAAATINILDDYLKGYPLEKVLKQWFKKIVLRVLMIEEI